MIKPSLNLISRTKQNETSEFFFLHLHVKYCKHYSDNG